MNLEDPCPNCGYRRKPMLMSTTPGAPGVIGLWKGEGDPRMQVIAKVGVLTILFLVILGLFVMLR